MRMGKHFVFEGIEPGSYKLEFVNGVQRVVNVVDYVRYANGGLMYLLDENDVVYNFNTVISFKKAQVIENG